MSGPGVIVLMLVTIFFVLSASISWYSGDSARTRRVLHPPRPGGSSGRSGGGSIYNWESGDTIDDMFSGGGGTDALCSREALLTTGDYDLAAADSTLWGAPSAMTVIRTSTSACENSAACSVLATPFIAQEIGSYSYSRKLQNQAEAETTYTMWSANATFFISNTTLELAYSKCVCERKAIQLAVHEVTSSTKESKYVSMPALALLTANGAGFGSHDAVFSVRMRIRSIVSRSSLESVLIAMANSFTANATTTTARKLLSASDNNVNSPMSTAIRSFAQSESLIEGAATIVDSFACTSPEMCQAESATKPTPMPTLRVPTMAPVMTRVPTMSSDNTVTRASLQTQCLKYMTDNFSSALWGIYGANYEEVQDAATATSKLSQKTSFYGIWLYLLMAGWCVVGVYVIWKVCIGYAACGTNWRSMKETLSRPTDLAWLCRPPTKAARQFMAICVIGATVVARLVYLSLVTSLTSSHKYSSFTCVELSPYLVGGEKFVRTGMFFVCYGLYAPLLLLAVLLRKGIVDAVAQQIGIVLVRPDPAGAAARMPTTTFRPAVRIVAIVGVFVAFSSIAALFIAYFVGGAPADMNGNTEEDAAEDGVWSNVRHWSLITQMACSCMALAIQLYLPHPPDSDRPSRNTALDTKLARQYESYAANVPNSIHANSRTHTLLEPRARSLNGGEVRWAETRAREIQRHERNSSPPQPRENGLRHRNSTHSTNSSRENTADSDNDNDKDAAGGGDSSHNGKAIKYVAGSGRKIERKSRLAMPVSQIYDVPQQDGSINLVVRQTRRGSSDAANIMSTYPPPPRINDEFIWFVMSLTCGVTILTAIPDITTGSWFGSFVLYSSIQRVLELVCACCCLRYVDVERSYLRRRFLTECERVRFERSGVLRATDLHASFPTTSSAGNMHTSDADIEAPAISPPHASRGGRQGQDRSNVTLLGQRGQDDSGSVSGSSPSNSPLVCAAGGDKGGRKKRRSNLQRVRSSSRDSNIPGVPDIRLTIRDGQHKGHKHYRYPRSDSQRSAESQRSIDDYVRRSSSSGSKRGNHTGSSRDSTTITEAAEGDSSDKV